jgi:hypothetical protein
VHPTPEVDGRAFGGIRVRDRLAELLAHRGDRSQLWRACRVAAEIVLTM